MRKLSAALCTMFVIAGTVAVLALPAGAGSTYPPPPTTIVPPPTNPPPTNPPPTIPPPTTPTTAPATTTTTQAGSAGTQTGTAIAFTGSDSKPLVLIGVVAVVLGAVIVVATRRRGAVSARDR